MATKVYIKKGCNNYRTALRVNEYSTSVEFTNGNVLMGIPSRLITSEPFLQYPLENDERFGKVWFLKEVVGSEEKPAEPAKKTTGSNRVNKSNGKTAKTEVLEVTNLTDAIDWFAERKRVCASLEEVTDAMEEMKVVFPNWE
jgi:hypothetical protein